MDCEAINERNTNPEACPSAPCLSQVESLQESDRHLEPRLDFITICLHIKHAASIRCYFQVLAESEISIRLFKIFIDNKPLGLFESEIRELVKTCKSEDELNVLWHTLEKMTIFDHNQLHQGLRAMSLTAEAKVKLRGNLAIVAMAFNSDADGSQLVLQMLKTELPRELNFKLFNTVPAYVKKMKDYPSFLLIDDFSGTGDTVLNRLKFIENEAKQRNITVDPSVCLIAAMEKAKENIQNNKFEITVFKEIKAGISGYFSGVELSRMNSGMARIESELREEIRGKKLPSFGYGQAEALYFIHPGNAPNSNFPIFWWPELKDGRPRKTIMKRAEL